MSVSDDEKLSGSYAVGKFEPCVDTTSDDDATTTAYADEKEKIVSQCLTDLVTTVADTVHYLSPVSLLSPRTVHEGEVGYDYIRLFERFPPLASESSSFKSSSISYIERELQRTIAIVKPEAMKYEDVILRAVFEAGFATIDKRYLHFTPEQVSEFYCQYYGSPAFPHYVVSMSVGPVLVLSLAGMNAVTKWKDMIGPERVIREEWFFPMSMRIRFGLMQAIPNSLHASENIIDANKENRYVYPNNILEPIIHELPKVKDYCELYINPTLLKGLTEVVRIKPIEPILCLAEWLLLHNPFQPEFIKEIGLIPT